jgi:hypothetical protein
MWASLGLAGSAFLRQPVCDEQFALLPYRAAFLKRTFMHQFDERVVDPHGPLPFTQGHPLLL